MKRRASLALEVLWCALCVPDAQGVGARSTARPWHSPGNLRILVLAPHADDEAMGCAGTLLLHARRGDRVCVAIATDGRRSRVIRDPDRMAAQRRCEAGDAALILRVPRLEWLGLPEGEWQSPQLETRLAKLLREVLPDVIYAPSRVDFHPEHLRVAHALARALGRPDAATGARCRVRIYQVQVPLTGIVCNLVADVSTEREGVIAAHSAYRTQQGSVACAHRLRRYTARLHGRGDSAEAFWDMDVGSYRTLHETAPAIWPNAFRGLRLFPLTDPLAYATGRRERRRLRALVGADHQS